MNTNHLNAVANLIAEESFIFYANLMNVSVADVKDSILMGNEKVMKDLEELFSVGFKSAISALSK